MWCSVRTLLLVFLTVFMQWACAGSTDRSSTVPDNGLENSPLTTVRALVGHSALLPCDVTVSPAADAPILVLIFYGDKENPVYSVDARGSSVYSGTHWSDPDRLGSRASLKLREGPQGLLLRKLVAEDAGLYRCRVDFKRSPSRNYRINLEIIFPPRHLLITSSWDEGRVVSGVIGPYPEGADLTLACQVTGGDPPSKVIWWQGGSLVDDSCEVRSKDVTRNSLRLPRLTRADLLKKYTCHASNNNITAPLSDTVTIDIAFPPSSVRIWMEKSERDPILADSSGPTSGEASSQHRLVTMREGREASLACEAYGSRPQAFVLWKKNNRAVVSGNSISSTQTSKSHADAASSDHPLGDPSSMSSLKIIPTVEDHKAVISCTTYSPKLPDEALVDHVTLNVLYRPQLTLTYESPVIATSLEEGDGFTLVCHVHSNPTAGDVQWTKDGVPITASSPPAGVSVRGARLSVQGATRHLTGRYACAAANTEGVNTSDPLHVRVKFAPVCDGRQKMQYGTGHKEGVEIECSVDSHPAPLSFRWAFNRSSELVDIPQSSFISHGTSSTLRYIPHTELDFGFLLCWAANDVGLMEKPCMIEVIPAAKPDSVKNCRVHNNSSMPRSLVLVTCTAGYDGGLNQTFSLEVRDNEELHNRPLASIQHSPIPVFNTKGLELGRKFLFIITAVNSRGTSPPVTLTYTTSTLLASSLASNAYDGSHMTRVPWTLFIGVIFGVLISTLVCTSICLLVNKRISPNTQNNSTKIVYAGPIRDNDDKGGFGTLGPHGIIHCGKPGCEDEKPGSIDYIQRANNDYVTTLPQHCSDETLKETERFLCNSGPDVRMSTPQGWSQDPLTDGEDTYIRNPGYHMHSLSPPPPPPTFLISNLLTDADDQHLKHSPTSVETSSLSSSSSQRSSSNQGSYAKGSFKSSSQCYSNTSADSSDTVRRELRPDFLMVDESASSRTPLIQLPALESAV